MTEANKADFAAAENCHIYFKTLLKQNFVDAQNINDLETGKFLGRAHKYSNQLC